MKIGFDNEKYLKIQSEHIKERIAQFDGKLYMELGGKLFDDHHASRVLPGFKPDSKLRMLGQLRDSIEIVIVVSAEDIEKNKVRADLGITYDEDLYTVAKLGQHAKLGVGLEARQHTRGMVVIEEFATQLHIELSVELSNALLDMLRLNLEIFIVIETDFHNYSVMLGSSRPIPFFLSTTLSTKPRMRAATPSEASITRGAV